MLNSDFKLKQADLLNVFSPDLDTISLELPPNLQAGEYASLL